MWRARRNAQERRVTCDDFFDVTGQKETLEQPVNTLSSNFKSVSFGLGGSKTKCLLSTTNQTPVNAVDDEQEYLPLLSTEMNEPSVAIAQPPSLFTADLPFLNSENMCGWKH
jgi:hypothetical protein